MQTTHSTPAPQRPRVLFAAPAAGRPTEALRRAHVFARAMDAELLVLRVISKRRGRQSLRDTVLSVQQTVAVTDQTLRWFETVLPNKFPDEHLSVRCGRLLEEVVQLARERQVSMIVLPSSAGQSGAVVTNIAQSTNVPVLVARAATGRDTIVAATDLRDELYPVMQRASALGSALHSHLVFVHNVAPIPIPMSIDVPAPLFVSRPDSEQQMRTRLLRISSDLSPNAEVVVEGQLSTAEVILSAARARNAELVVVGSRPRSWFRRVIGNNVAAEVVERSRRSILVMPLQRTA